MDAKIPAHLHQINLLSTEIDALYHQAALKLGLSDSAMFVLYQLYAANGCCLLQTLSKCSGIGKQTIHSALQKLTDAGLVSLEKGVGRCKTVHLTCEGTQFAEHTIARLFAAEANAFSLWKEEEILLYLQLTEKFKNTFRAQLETL